MNPKLEYCGNYIEIKDFKHFIEEEKAGNPYNCVFSIKVKSGLFAGYANACEADYKEVKKLAEKLDELINFKISEFTFTEISYGNSISFIADKFGHIKIKGNIMHDGDMMTHSLKFEFIAEQTVFSDFITALRNL